MLAYDLFHATNDPPAECAGDACTKEGALRLKAKIEEFWLERGKRVEIKLVEAGFVPAMRSARTDLRSDMRQGWPLPSQERRHG